MRIVQLANFYGPTSGGLRTFVDEVGRRYGAAGHERTLVVPGPRDADEATPAGRRIQLAGPALPVARGYRVLTDRRRVLDLLDRLEPEALEINDRLLLGWVAPWGRARGVPVLAFVHERLDAVLREWAPRWLPAGRAATAVTDVANRRLLDRADRLVVASRFAAAEFHRVGGSHVRVVPLGADPAGSLPVVLRLFDEDLAARVTSAFDLTISRSVSYLAAPAFAAAMIGREVVDTISVGRHVLLLAELPVGAGSPLEGRRCAEVNQAHATRLVAVRTGRGAQTLWRPPLRRTLVRTDRLLVVTTRTGLADLLPRTLGVPNPPPLIDVGPPRLLTLHGRYGRRPDQPAGPPEPRTAPP
jgi:hypothetical protein